MPGRPNRGMGFSRDDRNERRWRDVEVRPLTTSRPQLRTSDLRVAGLLELGAYGYMGDHDREGAASWQVDVEVSAEGNELELSLRTTAGATGFDTLMLLREPCRFGGSRPWLYCPRCIERATVFFVDLRARHGHAVDCRRCAGLVYPTTRMREHDRLDARAERIAARLVWDEDGEPVRPKGMHCRTFDRLVEEHDGLREREAEAFDEYIDRHPSRMADLARRAGSREG